MKQRVHTPLMSMTINPSCEKKMLGASAANAWGLPCAPCLELLPVRCFIGHAQKQFSQTNFDLCSYPPPPLGNRPLKGQIRQRLQCVRDATTLLAQSHCSIRVKSHDNACNKHATGTCSSWVTSFHSSSSKLRARRREERRIKRKQARVRRQCLGSG